MSDHLDFLIQNGMSLEQIKDILDRKVPMDEIVDAAKRALASGKSLATDESSASEKWEGKRLTLEGVNEANVIKLATKGELREHQGAILEL